MHWDNVKFAAALALALVFGLVTVIVQERESGGDVLVGQVDLAAVEKKVEAGDLTFHEADYWEVLDPSAPDPAQSAGEPYQKARIDSGMERGMLNGRAADHWVPMEEMGE